ncbi:MAG: DUF4159 domain-containing protein [Planctomycetes bacterium]|nr:DUF4159 domain-containing protein [Planctomycetota bacterium]
MQRKGLALAWVALVVGLGGLSPQVRALSWAERAGKRNSTEISAQDARQKNAEEQPDRRNKICMRIIRPARKNVDWDTDPTAIPYLLYQFNKRTQLPVHVEPKGLDVSSDELFKHTLVYLTAHVAWNFNDKEAENMARFLKRGGTLLLDDCYNRGSPFATCVRPEVSKLIPGADSAVVLDSDPKVADVFKMTYQNITPGSRPLTGSYWQYFDLDGRPAVFFSPNDDGCAWEVSTPPTASNPIGEGIGHGGDNRARENSYQLTANWLLFVYTH